MSMFRQLLMNREKWDIEYYASSGLLPQQAGFDNPTITGSPTANIVNNLLQITIPPPTGTAIRWTKTLASLNAAKIQISEAEFFIDGYIEPASGTAFSGVVLRVLNGSKAQAIMLNGIGKLHTYTTDRVLLASNVPIVGLIKMRTELNGSNIKIVVNGAVYNTTFLSTSATKQIYFGTFNDSCRIRSYKFKEV